MQSKSQSAGFASEANHHRSNGGVALHGVLPLATEIRLKSIDKQGVKCADESHTKDTN